MSDARTRKSVLGLLAKWPAAGQVKTRLARETSPAWAAEVAMAFVRDAIAQLVELPVLRHLVYAPASAGPDFERLTQDRYTLTPQSDGDLGARMSAFLEQQLAEGADAVVLVGADSPTLPLLHVEHAFEALHTADLVIGPTCDGGYYLVGCGRKVPPIFKDMPWSTSRVLAETMVRVRDPEWKLALLPPWYDVDTLDDWHMLRGHVAAIRKAGGEPRIPWTAPLLEGPQP